MFGNKKMEDNRPQAQSSLSSGATNSLVQGTHIEGIIKATNDIRIDGALKGDLHCDGRVIIGKDGRVEGKINCENAVIEGEFLGNLNVSDTLQVKDSATIRGEVNTGNLVVQAGATFDVSCGMGSEKIKTLTPETMESSNLKNANA